MELKKEYDLRELLNEATTKERVALAYNILSGVDYGLLGAAWYPGVCFTLKEILNNSLIEAYKKVYPSDQGYQYIVKSYDGEDTWIHYSGQGLYACIYKAYEICEDHVSVEVLAQRDGIDDECILYIGPDRYSNPSEPTSIGEMRIAEYQDVYRVTGASL